MTADLILSFLACSLDPATGRADRATCVHIREVVASTAECAERFRELKLTLPAGLTLGSYPECYRDRRRR